MRILLRGLTLAVVFSCIASAQGVPTPVGPAVLTVPLAVNATVTSCATPVVIPNVSANTQLALFVLVKASPTGTTPTLTYTISEVDPGDGATVFTGAQTASTLAINAIGDAAPITLSTTHSTSIKVSCAITGASASFTQVWVTLTSFGGALNTVQGCGVAGTPACGVVTVDPSGAKNFPVTGSLTPLDTAGTLVGLTAACATGVSCGANTTALVQLAGQQSANVTFSTGSTPVETVVADCAGDGGTVWQLTGSPSTTGVVWFRKSDGTISNAITNPGNTTYSLVLPPTGCEGSTTIRVRVAAFTSGSVNAQVRAAANAQAPTAGAIGANSYPPAAIAMMWRDPTTSTTSNAALGNATGELVQGAGANGATASGNPLRAGAIARATGAAPAQVTAGQTADLQSDLEHRLWVAAEHPNGSSCIVDAASASTQCVGLSGSGLSYYIKSVTFSASAAITFKVNSSTTAGNACATSPALVIPTMFFGANSGAPITFPQPIKVTANSALCCLPSGASGSCIIAGYIAP